MENGNFTEKGEYTINNSTKPYYIEGLIKNGNIIEHKVKK